MKTLILAVIAAAMLGALAPVASADSLDSSPLSITASGTGELQILDGSTAVFFPGLDQGHAGLEIKANGDYWRLDDSRRHFVSGPTLTEGATVDDPDTLTSVYTLRSDADQDVLQVTEVLSYVAGERGVDVHYDVKNLADVTQNIRAVEAADLAYGDDRGRSFVLDHHGSRLVGGWTAEGNLVGIQEQTPWDGYEAGNYGTVFDDAESVAFTSDVDPTLVDNGVGVDWSQTLAVGETKSFDLRWQIGADVKVDTTIAAALEQAETGDIVTVPSGDYQLASSLGIDRDVTLLGGGARSTTIHGPSNSFVMAVADVSASLRAFTITGGDAGDGNGGGIQAGSGSVLQLTDSAITGNKAWDGGGIYAAGQLELLRSTVSNNSADQAGGGVYAWGGSIENSTLSGNTATQFGGGLFIQGGPVDLRNATIAGNAASSGGGLAFFPDTQIETGRNTIIAGNTGGSCAGPAAQIDLIFSISDDAGCLQGGGSGNHQVDPKIGGLYDNEGDTLTRAPQVGSPALDAGDDESCPRIDQRGFLRPAGTHCDIGAVEGAEDSAFLGVVTHVVNDNGGHATAASFVTHVRRGANDVAPAQTGSEGGRFFDVPSGTYRLVTTGPAGYSLTYGEDCAANGTFAVDPDGDAVCAVVANDTGAAAPLPATLKVITKVVNDDGGTNAPGDFSMHVRRGGADVAGSPKAGSVAGTTYTLAAGSYTVAPSASGVYTAAIGGACSASGAVTLAAGAVTTCTVTENDKPPVPHKTFNATIADGSVTIKLPGTDDFVTLGPGAQIPPGTVVDTRKGRVTLVAAADGKGGTATADFYDGLFKVGQTKGKKPITELTLVEKLSCKASGKKASIAKKKKRKRRLWGDGHGKFRTKGSFSSATVRGTHWLVQDTCTTTTTKVARGIVAVRDFAKKKTVLVKKGHKYVAKKRGK